MKPKGVNWKNWQKLLEFLKTRKPRQVHMAATLDYPVEGISFTIGEARMNCGTAACIAGHAALLWLNPKDKRENISIIDVLTQKCNLGSQWEHVYCGCWSKNGLDAKKREVIRYMTKALKERDVMVKL
jgi:hypothetical protein